MENVYKRVFITGGTGSVGSSLIEYFFNCGYSVYFQYSTNDSKAMILESLYKAKAFKIDFKHKFEMPDVSFDIIINNAGINISDVPVHKVTEEAWHDTLNVNLTAPFNICKYYLPKMVQKGWGRIININSIYGLRGVDENCPYNVSKHALTGLTKSIAKEYAIYGITCNEICPGAIESELMNRIADRVSKEGDSTPEFFLKEVASKYPAKRLVQPREVSALALFLASDNASFTNGCSIPVDGGLIC
jgi:3-hydroxybutyrate dehydrogenase